MFSPAFRIGDLAEARALFGMIATAPVEIAVIAYLDDAQRLLGLDHAVGGLDSVPLSPRAIAAEALRRDARQVLVAHNHPSGDATPSRADLDFARRLARALAAIEARLADLLVLAGPRTVSLRALGML